MSLPYNRNMIQRAKGLRKNMTPNAYDLEVIRISNAEVNKRFGDVCKMIDGKIKNKVAFLERV